MYYLLYLPYLDDLTNNLSTYISENYCLPRKGAGTLLTHCFTVLLFLGIF
jgi:hypothetical protein